MDGKVGEMSTRMTIASGKSWHLYEDATDETVWLETYGEPFQARTGEAGLRLPSAAIDAIRTARSGCFPHLRGESATTAPTAGNESFMMLNAGMGGSVAGKGDNV